MNQKKIFSLDKKQYCALVYFEARYNYVKDSHKLEKKFDFHVPVVKEDDDNYYSLCIELDEVCYSSNLEKAIDRIQETIIDKMYIAAEAKKYSNLFKSPMSKEYLNLFHELKQDYQIKNCIEIDNFLIGLTKNKKIVPQIYNKVEKQILSSYGDIIVEKIYEIELFEAA